MKTQENNKILAEFMGMVYDNHDNQPNKYWLLTDEQKFTTSNTYPQNKDLMFDSDWNWLMEVVEKIENLGCNVIMGRTIYSRFQIEHNHVKLNWSSNNNYQLFLEVLPSWMEGRKNSLIMSKKYLRAEIKTETTKLEAVYIACVEFVKWYNLNKTS